MNNAIITYEALHSMKARLKSKLGSMAIKLDIYKTNGKVEWVYLENIMRKLGFDHQ